MELADLERSLVAYVAETCGATRVEVAWLGVDPARVPPGALRWTGDACKAHPELKITYASGADLDSLSVRPTLTVWLDVPVAAAPVAVGQPVPLTTGPARLDQLDGGPWTQGPPIATRALRAGEPITAFNARIAPAARAGADVRLTIRAGALEIHADGRLLDDGQLGEPVRVLNRATGAVIRGTLVAEDAVELGGSP